jgi:arylsulfatase A-like enzyme
MTIRSFVCFVAGCLLAAQVASAQTQPNIVYIYADDLGFGDISSYGAKAVQTPNMDSIGRDGLRFTDAHAPASTCTPSRYALLTGQYAWRKPGTGILPGDAALIIDPTQVTLPSMLRKAGYATGVVGKWHLGLGLKGGPDWNGEITPSPNSVGFDSSFIMAATGDRVPTVYVENGHVVGLDPADPISVSYAHKVGDWPTGAEHPELLKMHPSHGHDQTIVNGISRIGYMTGGRAALWKDEEMASVFTRKAVDFIEQHRNGPFFLYFTPHEPHVPRVPNPRFVGKTTMGPRGDAIAELDWSVGEVLQALDRLGLAGNTIVILTSDNGPVVDDGYKDGAVEHLGSHKPAGVYRGGKYSSFEGGTRIPLLIRWPGHIAPGTSDALVCQIDFLASFAALAGQKLAPGEAPDSQDTLTAFLGTSKTGRDHLVEQGGGLAIRVGQWKYIEPNNRPKMNTNTNTELGNDTVPQLYDLAADPGEAHNLAASQAARVEQMAALLGKIRKDGTDRSGSK